MAKDILFGKDGDLFIDDSGIMYLTPDIQTSSVQQVYITLNTNKGSWMFNIEFGIPWLSNSNNPLQLLGKDGSKGLIDSLIREAILARENVTEILEYSSTVDKITKVMNVSFVFRTRSGEVVNIENIPIEL